MRKIERTGQFRRDYKREARGRHRSSLDAALVPILVALADDQPLEPRHHDHALSSNWNDHRDCHVKPDLLRDLPEARRRTLRSSGSDGVRVVPNVPAQQEPAELMRVAADAGTTANPSSSYCAHYPGSGAAKILVDAEKMFVDTVGMALLDPQRSWSLSASGVDSRHLELPTRFIRRPGTSQGEARSGLGGHWF